MLCPPLPRAYVHSHTPLLTYTQTLFHLSPQFPSILAVPLEYERATHTPSHFPPEAISRSRPAGACLHTILKSPDVHAMRPRVEAPIQTRTAQR